MNIKEFAQDDWGNGYFADKGLYVLNNAIQNCLCRKLVAWMSSDADCRWSAAGVGRDGGFQLDFSIRRDQIAWLSGCENAAVIEYWEIMQWVREYINRTFYLGLFDYECHFAHYPVGAFYKKHLDAFADQNTEKGNRKLSTILYLNEDWQPGDGGELVIYKPGSDEELVRVEPRLGTLVMFLSEEFPHEVLPANKPRWSLTGWFRTRGGL